MSSQLSSHTSQAATLKTPAIILNHGYKLKRPLTTGTSATVYLASSTKFGNDIDVVCKWIRACTKYTCPDKKNQWKIFFQKEALIMTRMARHPHPNLMYAYDIFLVEASSISNDDDCYNGCGQGFIMMPFMPNGTVAEEIYSSKEKQKSKSSIKMKIDPESQARIWFTDIMHALHWLHLNEIVHRDLKLENCLLGPMKRVVVSDYGFSTSREIGIETTFYAETILGSLDHMAPELVAMVIRLHEPDSEISVEKEPEVLAVGCQNYKVKPVDVYAAGVCLFEMLNYCPPFQPMNAVTQLEKEEIKNEQRLNKESDQAAQKQLIYRIATELYNKQMIRDYKFDQLLKAPCEKLQQKNKNVQQEERKASRMECIQMVNSCLAPNPTERPNTKQILDSEWLQNDI